MKKATVDAVGLGRAEVGGYKDVVNAPIKR
jgi:hypothetical protein